MQIQYTSNDYKKHFVMSRIVMSRNVMPRIVCVTNCLSRIVMSRIVCIPISLYHTPLLVHVTHLQKFMSHTLNISCYLIK